jgi:hypothetical protein
MDAAEQVLPTPDRTADLSAAAQHALAYPSTLDERPDYKPDTAVGNVFRKGMPLPLIAFQGVRSAMSCARRTGLVVDGSRSCCTGVYADWVVAIGRASASVIGCCRQLRPDTLSAQK